MKETEEKKNLDSHILPTSKKRNIKSNELQNRYQRINMKQPNMRQKATFQLQMSHKLFSWHQVAEKLSWRGRTDAAQLTPALKIPVQLQVKVSQL